MVLQDHRVRRPPAGRPRTARLARREQGPPGELDRPQRGRRADLRRRRRSPADKGSAQRTGRRLRLSSHRPRRGTQRLLASRSRLHHPPGHRLRRDLPRARPRAQAGPAHHHARAAARPSRRTSSSARNRPRSSAPAPSARRPASSPAPTPSTPPPGERVPIWVADYVLVRYGTGAIMAVPAHDERDHEFAQKFDLPIVEVVAERPTRPLRAGELALHRAGPLIELRPVRRPAIRRGASARSPPGWPSRARAQPTRHLPPARLADLPPALLGAADPDHLLPHGRHRARARGRPAGGAARRRGLPPDRHRQVAAGVGRVVRQHHLPDLRRPGRRETDVSDNFLDSAWYFLRYPCTEFDDRPFDRERIERWLPVDMYFGGKEHVVLHHLYSRFITKALHDLGPRPVRRAVQAAAPARLPDEGRRQDEQDRGATSSTPTSTSTASAPTPSAPTCSSWGRTTRTTTSRTPTWSA